MEEDEGNEIPEGIPIHPLNGMHGKAGFLHCGGGWQFVGTVPLSLIIPVSDNTILMWTSFCLAQRNFLGGLGFILYVHSAEAFVQREHTRYFDYHSEFKVDDDRMTRMYSKNEKLHLSYSVPSSIPNVFFLCMLKFYYSAHFSFSIGLLCFNWGSWKNERRWRWQ